jgi:nuclear transport factor 2 (NTF2) superfamily protein
MDGSKHAEEQIDEKTARSVLKTYERLFSAQDVDEILNGFTEDAEVEFADIPPMKGKAAIEAFLRSRFARQEGYQLSKSLRAINGNQVIGSWTGSWRDAVSGASMLGRGMEILTLVDGKCAKWEATFNMWEEGEGPQSALLMND